jgi:beta-lactamase class A
MIARAARWLRVALAASLVGLGAFAPSNAQSPSPAASGPGTLSELARARVDSLLRSGQADPSWFAPDFLAQIPASQVDTIVAQLGVTLGAYQSIDGTQGDYTARFAKGTVEVLVHLDAQNRIDGLFFKQPHVRAASLDAALRALQPKSGTLSYAIVENGRDLADLNSSAVMAVGSTFKLAVLAAMRDEIAHGKRRWTDVVPLRAQWKSLPSGVLQTWPDGTPLTLATYAAEMISISDNTAADALIRIAGPAALAPYAGNNEPFLTTREAFTLKSKQQAARRAAYAASRNAKARSAILRAVDGLPLPALDALDDAPSLAIEWHYSVRELCSLMHRVADLPLMSINPGVADAASFAHVAYKGGSDSGVLNLTTQVTTKRGSTLCFSATVNDATTAIDERPFELAYGSVLAALENS